MTLDLQINGEFFLKSYKVKEKEVEELSFLIDPELVENGLLTVTFIVNHIWKPSEVFGSMDGRELGIAVIEIIEGQ
jgi:hypothetical protein